MFGYVKVNKPELKVREYDKYKSYYCGLCRTLKESYGVVGQMTLTYDLTFLTVLLSALYECKDEVIKERCKTHPVDKISKRVNKFTYYAADMNLLLAYYSMADNWNDERNKKSLVLGRIIQKDVRKIINQYPRQAGVIRKELKYLHKLEREGCNNSDELASCFGRLMEHLFVYKIDEHTHHLMRMGFYLGKFIYLMDAYDDLPKDIENNSFNPLIEKSKSEGFDDYILQALNVIMAQCVREFELLPIVQDDEIIRNILYAGVWQQFDKVFRERKVVENGNMKGKDSNE